MAPMTCKHDEGVSERPRWHLQICCSVTDLSSRSVVPPLGIYSRKVGDSNNDVIRFFRFLETVPVEWHRGRLAENRSMPRDALFTCTTPECYPEALSMKLD